MTSQLFPLYFRSIITHLKSIVSLCGVPSPLSLLNTTCLSVLYCMQFEINKYHPYGLIGYCTLSPSHRPLSKRNIHLLLTCRSYRTYMQGVSSLLLHMGPVYFLTQCRRFLYVVQEKSYHNGYHKPKGLFHFVYWKYQSFHFKPVLSVLYHF